MNESMTPKTDALLRVGTFRIGVTREELRLFDHARQLERELAKVQSDYREIVDYVMGYFPVGMCYSNPIQAIRVVVDRMVTAERDLAAALARAEAAEADARRLERSRYDLAHAIWRALDDSGNDGENITIMRDDFNRLCDLVPEDLEELHKQFDPHVHAAIEQEKKE